MSSAAEFKIEDGVPLPGFGRGSKERGLAHALRQMQIGQSILVPDRDQRHVSSQACATAKFATDGRRYTTRVVDGGVRVWRVA